MKTIINPTSLPLTFEGDTYTTLTQPLPKRKLAPFSSLFNPRVAQGSNGRETGAKREQEHYRYQTPALFNRKSILSRAEVHHQTNYDR